MRRALQNFLSEYRAGARSNIKGWRDAINSKIQEAKDIDDNMLAAPTVNLLSVPKTPEELGLWRFVTDSESGGRSEATLRVETTREGRDYLVFEGILNQFMIPDDPAASVGLMTGKLKNILTNKQDDHGESTSQNFGVIDANPNKQRKPVIRSVGPGDDTLRPVSNGFAAFYCPAMNPLLDIGEYNRFCVTAQTDMHQYNFNVQVDRHFVEPVYKGFMRSNMTIRKPGRIEFEHLFQTIGGSTTTMMEKFEGDKVKALGFGVSGVGPFRFELHGLTAERDEEEEYVMRYDRNHPHR